VTSGRAPGISRQHAPFTRAATIARRTGDAEHLARAALGYGGRFVWARAGDDASVIPLLQDALVALGGEDDRLRVRLLPRLACAWRGSAQHRDQSAALSQQAVELARDLDDPTTLCFALVGRYGAIYWPENAGERLAIAEELLAVAEAASDPERMIDAHMTHAFTYADLGRMHDAWAEIEHLTRLAHELRQPAQLWLAIATRAAYTLLEGDFAAAERLIARESEPGFPTTPIRDDVSAVGIHRFLLRREQDRLSEIESDIRASAAEFPWYPVHRVALACLLAELGRADEARAVFGELASSRFSTFVRDNEWLLTASLGAEVCAMLGDSAAAASLYEQLAPFAGVHAIGHAEGSVGAVDRYLGVLAATVGDLDAARHHLDAAIAVNRQLGARPWTAHSQADLAALLTRRGARGDAARAAELRWAALATARDLGMLALERRLNAQSVEPAELDARSVEAAAAEAMFVREGDFWAIGRERVFRLRHAKGLAYLNVLLANPGREFHALELAAGPAAVAAGAAASSAAMNGLRSDATAAAGEILDPQAKAAYRERLRELQDEVADADAAADPARGERARAEIEAITAELSAAFGLGGRARPEGSPAERARQSVTKAVRDALRRIRAEDPALGDHLARAVRTGLYCAYDPDPAAAVSWRT
jgi:tetratricopeptide (TPR) repeat protein